MPTIEELDEIVNKINKVADEIRKLIGVDKDEDIEEN